MGKRKRNLILFALFLMVVYGIWLYFTSSSYVFRHHPAALAITRFAESDAASIALREVISDEYDEICITYPYQDNFTVSGYNINSPVPEKSTNDGDWYFLLKKHTSKEATFIRPYVIYTWKVQGKQVLGDNGDSCALVNDVLLANDVLSSRRNGHPSIYILKK